MRKECMHCHRSYVVSTSEQTETSVTHGYCAKCLFCVQYNTEALDQGISVSEWLEEHPAEKKEIK